MGLDLNLINLYFQWGDKVKKIIKRSIPTFQLNGQKCPAGPLCRGNGHRDTVSVLFPFFKKISFINSIIIYIIYY